MAHLQRKSAYSVVYVAICVSLLIVCSWISVPLFVSFTMQTFALFLIAFLLNWKYSLLTVLVYLTLGIVGVPVFSGFGGGIAVLFGHTGGYLLSFPLVALTVGLCKKRFGTSAGVQILSSAIALSLCYILGTLWYARIYTANVGSVSFQVLLSMCVFPFILPDILKIGLAMLVAKKLSPYLKTQHYFEFWR